MTTDYDAPGHILTRAAPVEVQSITARSTDQQSTKNRRR